VHPGVGDLLGPGGEGVVELGEALDVGGLGLGQEALADVAVEALLLATALRLTGQSEEGLLGPSSRTVDLSRSSAPTTKRPKLFLVSADIGGDGFEALAEMIELDDDP
jgi:hypothetical protein